jgi:Zn-dependent protease with chaperone function
LASGSDRALPLAPRLIELGTVPFLAAGGLTGNELWISTHTLDTSPLSVLRCMVAHEAGHVVLGNRRLGCAWVDLTWLAAYIVADVVAQWPLALAAAVALHVSLWLRLQDWYTSRSEEAADRWAAQQTSLLGYARSLAVYLAAFEQPGGAQLRRRLVALGMEPEQLDMILEEARGSVAG